MKVRNTHVDYSHLKLDEGNCDCGVVLPTGIHSLYPMGDLINKCRRVIRAGSHPTVGYEVEVGSRTDTVVLGTWNPRVDSVQSTGWKAW